jgi:hypothetical protein
MPANRRRRRAQAAQTRHAATVPRPRLGPLARVGLAAAGMLCIVIGIVVIVTPHGSHIARAFSFLVVLGGALVAAAWLA